MQFVIKIWSLFMQPFTIVFKATIYAMMNIKAISYYI